MDVLRDSIWQFIGVIVAIFFGLAGLVLSIILATRQQKRKEILFDIVQNTPLSSFKISDKLKMPVIFEGEMLDDVNLVDIKIWNEGNGEVLPNDFYEPITFELGKTARILEAVVKSTTPTTIKDKIHISWDGNTISLQPLLLNAKDTIVLHILVTGYKDEITAKARIAGVQQVKDLRETELNGVGYIASIGWAAKEFYKARPYILPLFIMVTVLNIVFAIISSLVGEQNFNAFMSRAYFIGMSLFAPLVFGLFIFIMAQMALQKRKFRYKSWLLLGVSFILPALMFIFIFYPFFIFAITHK